MLSNKASLLFNNSYFLYHWSVEHGSYAELERGAIYDGP